MPSNLNPESLKNYLLGRLEEGAREDLDKRLMTNDALFDELLAIEDELIDDYLAGHLGREEMKIFEENLSATPEGQQRLRFSQALRQYAHSHPLNEPTKVIQSKFSVKWLQIFSNPYVRSAAVAALLIMAGLGIWRVFLFQSDVDKGLIALNAAFHEQRPVEARVSQLKYAPFPTTRGAEIDRVDTADRDRAEALLHAAFSDHPSAESQRALGTLYLTKHEFDKAIQHFEEALRTEKDNAQIYADLGAAYLERGKSLAAQSDPSGKSTEDVSRSLESLSTALALDGNLLDALFNRALSLQEQRLWKQAEDAWQDYLRHDSTSEWATEARARLSELQGRKRDGVRNNKEILDSFLGAYRRRDDEVAWKILSENYTSAGSPIANSLILSFLAEQNVAREEDLRALTYLAELERDRAADSYHADLVKFYTLLPVEKLSVMARVEGQMASAFDALTKSNSKEAIALYTSSKQALEKIGNAPGQVFADYRLAHSYVTQGNIDKGREVFMRLSTECDRLQYRWLSGQVLLGLAHISLGANEYSLAIDFSKRGVTLFKRCGYIDGLVRTLRQLAEEYQIVNRVDESLAVLKESLEVTENHFVDPNLHWGLYMTVAFNLDSLKLLTATLAYQKEALALAKEIDRPLVLSRSYAYLGATYGKLGNFTEADRNLSVAYELGSKVGNDRMGIEMMANSSLQLGDLYRESGDSGKALEAYDRSLKLYDQLKFPYFIYSAERGKLLTYVSMNDFSGTENQLGTLLSSLEDFRKNIDVESQRNSFFASQQDIYDAAINFAYSRKHDSQAAFQYSEMNRARTLLDALQQSGSVDNENIPEFRLREVYSPPSLMAMRDAMPDNVELVQYAVLDNAVLIWVVSKKSFDERNSAVTKDELSRKVRAYLETMTRAQAGSESESVLAGELHALLIKPVEDLLDKKQLVVIVPDKSLSYLPFAALKSPESNRYVLQDYTIQMAPSMSVFLKATDTATRKTERSWERLVSIGNPSFDRAAFPSLQDLPSARREAESIAEFYKSPYVVVQRAAREQEIKDRMKNADVVHLALHYVLNDRSETLSSLLLAKEEHVEGGNEGQLKASEVYQMKLPRTRLTVLSACQTGIDRSFDGEGAIGMARPFLVAEVPLVVASLWPVDSHSTTELMIRFHKHRTMGGESTVSALRSAQLELLNDSSLGYQQAYNWGSFVLIGGAASF